MDIKGPPGTVMILHFDSRHGNVPIPGFAVPFLLNTGVIPGPILTIGANGSTLFILTLPVDPFWKNKFLFFQGVAVQPQPGPITLTNLGDLRMR